MPGRDVTVSGWLGAFDVSWARANAIDLDAARTKGIQSLVAGRAEVLIVTDIAKGDLPALAGAYARIIEACGGGVLGLFTAIRRLRAVQPSTSELRIENTRNQKMSWPSALVPSKCSPDIGMFLR